MGEEDGKEACQMWDCRDEGMKEGSVNEERIECRCEVGRADGKWRRALGVRSNLDAV